jgi:ribosomal protein S18 acetylase RimI-like enzyme
VLHCGLIFLKLSVSDFLLILSKSLLVITPMNAYYHFHFHIFQILFMIKQEILTTWVTDFSDATSRAIIELVDCATADGGTLGFVQSMQNEEAQSFVNGLRHRVAEGKTHVLLGSAVGQPVFLAILNLNEMPNCRHRAELSKGVVRPDFRGRRLVELAFAQIVQRSTLLGIEQLVLDVRENSRAHILWQRFGFVTYGVLEDYARVHSEVCRGHFMVQAVDTLRERLEVQIIKTSPFKETYHA